MNGQLLSVNHVEPADASDPQARLSGVRTELPPGGGVNAHCRSQARPGSVPRPAA